MRPPEPNVDLASGLAIEIALQALLRDSALSETLSVVSGEQDEIVFTAAPAAVVSWLRLLMPCISNIAGGGCASAHTLRLAWRPDV